jgi:type IV pilus assembly protein PilE
MQKTHGFQLLELLIVIAIIGILATLNMPIYSTYLVKAKRLAAETSLAKLALALETYQINHQTFEGVSFAKLKMSPLTRDGAYQLSFSHLNRANYLMIAEPIGQQAEADRACGELHLSANGEKSITGNGRIADCW